MKPAGPIRRSIYSATLLALFAVMPFVFAQSAAPSAATLQPEFEAVSIHLVDPHAAENPSRSSLSSFPTNLFTMRGVPLTFLIQLAYNIESADYISAMPGWMESQEYHVSAKVEGDQQLTLEQMRPMLQRLLEQRFHLVFHRETKMTAGFELIVAKGGPKLQPSKNNSKPSAQLLSNRLDVGHMNAEHIAGVLAHRAGQPVVDKTGLTGNYDFTLSYAPANDSNSSLPDFFTALQEQLGLKLESQKVPVNFLVIDHVDKIPTEN
ncbi:TIGR03435 family protein [Granulicella sp. L46]|uniref:TIGR03435 family protein n=1 Tax=Granulicella sp. L46 TaxID=1641865 RepID=UPI00131C8FA2|nr:TIGR03435 family protein [Granulicella sp. L46]